MWQGRLSRGSDFHPSKGICGHCSRLSARACRIVPSALSRLIEGIADPRILQAALRDISDRYEILRTAFRSVVPGIRHPGPGHYRWRQHYRAYYDRSLQSHWFGVSAARGPNRSASQEANQPPLIFSGTAVTRLPGYAGAGEACVACSATCPLLRGRSLASKSGAGILAGVFGAPSSPRVRRRLQRRVRRSTAAIR